MDGADSIFPGQGWLGTLITIGLTCLATFINIYGYKKLPIMEGVAVPLYFAVFIVLVSVIVDVEPGCSLTKSQARRVLGDGGPWRCGGLHEILE